MKQNQHTFRKYRRQYIQRRHYTYRETERGADKAEHEYDKECDMGPESSEAGIVEIHYGVCDRLRHTELLTYFVQ